MVNGDSSNPQAGYIPTPIICPQTNTKVDGKVSIDKAQKLAKYGPAYRFHELLTLVRETLADPDSILEYTEEDWKGYCYAQLRLPMHQSGSGG